MNRITRSTFPADRSGLAAVVGCCGVGAAVAPAAVLFGFSWAGVYQAAYAAAVAEVTAADRQRLRSARSAPGLN